MIIDKITPFGAEALVVLVLSNISNLIYVADLPQVRSSALRLRLRLSDIVEIEN